MGKGKLLLGAALALGLLIAPTLSTSAVVGTTPGRFARSEPDGSGIHRSMGWLPVLDAGSSGQAFAAEEAGPRVKQMKLSFWPEYDEPRVLVIYDGEFADKSGFPKEVRFRVPKGAEISQVCGIGDKGDHLCQLYEVKQEADYNVVVYTVPVPHFLLEYYVNPVGGEQTRNIAYSFSASYPMDKLDVEVQQPLRSTDFTLSPMPLSTGSDGQGFKYSQLSFEKVVPDQKIELKMSYSKQDNRPSVPKKQGSGATGGVDSSNLNLWVLLGGSALLGLAAFIVIGRRPNRLVPQAAGYGGRSGGQANYARPSVYTKPTARAKGALKAQEAAAFCTGCGTPLAADDRFCPKCGKRSKNAV